MRSSPAERRHAVNAVGARVLVWCAAGTAATGAVLWRAGAGNPDGFSPIFWYLLTAYDGHGNLLLAALAAGAWFLRRRTEALPLITLAAERPWTIAAFAFVLFCAGALGVYRNAALSLDEYAALFQAQAFAAGRLAGTFPPDLLDALIPRIFQGHFFAVSSVTGEVSSRYWPGFALLLAPFAFLDIPWAANPAIGALSLPVLHRLTQRLTGSREAAGWAIVLALASPAYVVSSISYYAMPAHLLCNALYALLLVAPTARRAFAAGMIGSLALALHNPVPHLLFALPFLLWLVARAGSRPGLAALAALAAGYAPLALLLGVGWHLHLGALTHAAGPVAASAAAPAVADAVAAQLGSLISLPGMATIQARLAGLSKVWTWAAACLVVIAALGFRRARHLTGARVLAAALAVTVAGYFLVWFDQGHGWGYRYLHSAWFVLPLLAAFALDGAGSGANGELRCMAAWAVVLSALLAVGLRLVQVNDFIAKHYSQVPPLARAPDPRQPEVVFVNLAAGPYARDLVQNDPFLRGARVTLVYDGADRAAALMAGRFPGYRRIDGGRWGELWTTAKPTPAN